MNTVKRLSILAWAHIRSVWHSGLGMLMWEWDIIFLGKKTSSLHRTLTGQDDTGKTVVIGCECGASFLGGKELVQALVARILRSTHHIQNRERPRRRT